MHKCRQEVHHSYFVLVKSSRNISAMWLSMQRAPASSRGQQSTSKVFFLPHAPRGRGGSAHSLVIKVLVMSHEEGVGGGWDGDKETERDRKRERGREREEVRVGEGCLHYLQVSSHVARRLTDFYCLAMNLPALCSAARVPACPFIYSTHPLRTCTSTLHSEQGSVQQSPCIKRHLPTISSKSS